MDKKFLVASIFLFFAVLILFLPAIIGWQGVFTDDVATSEFLVQYSAASHLQRGVFPNWDPYTWAGASPFNFSLSNAGGNIYPLWLFYLFADLSDFNNAYWLITILPLFTLYFFAGIGMFLLLKKAVRCSYFAAIVGALAYIYSPVFVYYFGSTNGLGVLACLPWLIYAYIRAVEDWRLWRGVLAGISFAFIILAGRPHFLPYVMFIWGTIIFSKAISNRSTKKGNFFRPFAIAFFVFVLGTLLSAIYWVPLVHTLWHSSLYTELTAEAALANREGALPFFYLITLFIPSFFGSITGESFIFKPLVFSEANMSGGIATTFLVLLGASLPFVFSFLGRKAKTYRKFAAVGIFLYFFSVFAAMGENTFFYRTFISWIPVVGGFPFPVRYRFIQCFAASLLIAIGISTVKTFRFSINKHHLRKILYAYLFLSFCFVGLVLFLPQDWQRKNLWEGEYNMTEVKGFFEAKEPVGLLTPKIDRIRRIRIKFNGASEGKIKYSNSRRTFPAQGNLVKEYKVEEAGWAEFLVDIPPDQFLWIYPESGPGRVGYWHQGGCLLFRYASGENIHPNINAISIHPSRLDSVFLYLEEKQNSLFSDFRKGRIVKRPIVGSLMYWGLVLFLLVIGSYFFLPKKFILFISIIVLAEYLVFGLAAFYHSTFVQTQPRLEHLRYKRPLDHPMLQQVAEQLPKITTNPDLRVASNYPLYDNFVYLNSKNARFALMGTPINPLEKRFKKALEKAYGQPVRRSIHHKTFSPVETAFLNNFSVGYFISTIPTQVFPKEKVLHLKGKINSYLHSNKDVLPRVYTIDRVIAASEEKQLKELVLGDLRKAVYLSPKENIRGQKQEENQENYILHFKQLQDFNLIRSMDFSKPSQIKIEIDVAVPSMLVLTEVWYPGWEVLVNGEKRNLHRVNYCQRGVWLGKGGHKKIEMRFNSPFWRLGAIFSLGTSFLSLFLLGTAGVKKAIEKFYERKYK